MQEFQGRSVLKMLAIAAILASAGLAAAWASIWDEAGQADQARITPGRESTQPAAAAPARPNRESTQSGCPETQSHRSSIRPTQSAGGCCPSDAPADSGCSDH